MGRSRMLSAGASCAAAIVVAAGAHAQRYPTELVSVGSLQQQGDMESRESDVSRDGRYVAFVSRATNFSDTDPDARLDVFLRDRWMRETTLVSIGAGGEISDGDSRFPAITGDGRYIAFESTASTFDPDDANAQRDVFVRDAIEGTTEIVSVTPSGQAGNGSSGAPSISDDARWVCFVSDSTDLVPNDFNGENDVFLRDRLFNTTQRVNVRATGVETGGSVVGVPAMTPDGRYIAYASRAQDVIAGDPFTNTDVFLWDRCTGTVELISRTPDGQYPTAASFSPAISDDGRYVAFSSEAEDLLDEDDNGVEDVFVWDRQTETMLLASVSTGGEQGAAPSFSPSISGDGQRVLFESLAENLVAGDDNGAADVFSHHLNNRATYRQSLTWRDRQANDESRAWRVASGGDYATFSSPADNLAPVDDNTARDAWIRWIGDPCIEREPNDVFEDRTWINLDANDCATISGKLDETDFDGPRPDTFMIAYDKQDNVIATDDNSSPLGDGKASALWVEPVANGNGTTSVRLAITGRRDGADGKYDGLFFNAPHGERGGFELFVRYFDESGDPVLDDCDEPVVDARGGGGDDPLQFESGAELFRLNFEPPPGTAMVHVEIDNTVGTVGVCDDVDHFAFAGLDPLCDYAVTIVGGVEDDCDPTDVRFGWFDKEGELVSTVPEGFGPGDPGPRTISVLSDAQGRINIALTGRADIDFDGLADVRRDAAGGVEIPVGHGVCGCYSLLVERFEHEPSDPDGDVPDGMAQMSAGDLNLDGGVDVLDLAIMLNNWGPSSP